MGVIVALVGVAAGIPAVAEGAQGRFDAGLMVANVPAFQWGVVAAGLVVLALLWIRGTIRPSRLARGGGRDVSGLPALVWLIAALAVFVSQAIGGGLALALPASVVGPKDSPRHDGIVSLCGYGAAAAVGLFLVYALEPRAGAKAGIRARWTDMPWGLLAFAVALPVVLAAGIAGAATAALITGEEPPMVGHETLQRILDQRSDPWVWAVIAGAAIGAPLVEELTFRVFLQSSMLRVTGNPVLAVVMTAGLFTAMHLTVAGAHTLPTLLVLGLALGIAYERTKRAGVPITMHVAFNVMMLGMAMASRG